MSNVLCGMSYALCLMSNVLCNTSWTFGQDCFIVLFDVSCLRRANLSCIQDTADTHFSQPCLQGSAGRSSSVRIVLASLSLYPVRPSASGLQPALLQALILYVGLHVPAVSVLHLY